MWLVPARQSLRRASDVGCIPRTRLACDERPRTVLRPTTHPIAPYPRKHSKLQCDISRCVSVSRSARPHRIVMAVGVLKVLWSVVWCVYEVATFWQRVRLPRPSSNILSSALWNSFRYNANMLKALWSWWTSKSRRDHLLDVIDNARLFEEWGAAAYSLDECMDYDMWYAFVSFVIRRSLHKLTHNTGDRVPLANITITA
jgi:hypothetical protein